MAFRRRIALFALLPPSPPREQMEHAINGVEVPMWRLTADMMTGSGKMVRPPKSGDEVRVGLQKGGRESLLLARGERQLLF